MFAFHLELGGLRDVFKIPKVPRFEPGTPQTTKVMIIKQIQICMYTNNKFLNVDGLEMYIVLVSFVLICSQTLWNLDS